MNNLINLKKSISIDENLNTTNILTSIFSMTKKENFGNKIKNSKIYIFLFGKKISEKEKFLNKLRRITYYNTNIKYEKYVDVLPLFNRLKKSVKNLIKKYTTQSNKLHILNKGSIFYKKMDEYFLEKNLDFKKNRIDELQLIQYNRKDYWRTREKIKR